MNANETAQLIAKNVDLEAIGNTVKDELLYLKKTAEEGEWTWKLTAVISGCMLCFSSFLGVASALMYMSPFLAVLNVYIFCIGAGMLMLEYKDSFLTKKYVAVIRKEALFLTRPYGRAIFYIFVGSLVVVSGGWLNFMIGLFTSTTGALIYTSSRSSYEKLGHLKAQLTSDQAVAAGFQSFDRDASGALDTAELAKLCQALGSPLSHNELESALFILDKDGSGAIDYAEFLEWWRGHEQYTPSQ